jgi:hypothetical protein
MPTTYTVRLKDVYRDADAGELQIIIKQKLPSVPILGRFGGVTRPSYPFPIVFIAFARSLDSAEEAILADIGWVEEKNEISKIVGSHKFSKNLPFQVHVETVEE